MCQWPLADHRSSKGECRFSKNKLKAVILIKIHVAIQVVAVPVAVPGHGVSCEDLSKVHSATTYPLNLAIMQKGSTGMRKEIVTSIGSRKRKYYVALWAVPK